MKQNYYTSVVIFFVMLFSAVGMTALAQSDIDAHRDCTYCGMDRKAYGYSRMLVQYEDGAEVGTCSLHCVAIELDKNKGRKVTALLVADRDSRILINAEQAVWVMGGSKRGVMTQNPTWAFQSKAGAEAFMKANGGKIVPWSEALAAAKEEIQKR